MAYAISEALLSEIRAVIAAYRESGLIPPPSAVVEPDPDFSTRWFLVTDTIPVGGRGSGVCVATGSATETGSGTWQAEVSAFKSSWLTDLTPIHDSFLRASGQGVRKYTLIQCVKVKQKWVYWQGAGQLRLNEQLSATATTDLIGADPQLSYVGKTTSAWAKGTWATITLYTGTPGSETILQTIKPGDTVLSNVTLYCYNRYADVASGKWVRVTGGGELVSAEC